MSVTVKEWKPNDSCESCKQAKRIMQEHTRAQQEYHGKVLKKLKEQNEQIEALKKLVEYMSESHRL